jgi:TolA-binding protein
MPMTLKNERNRLLAFRFGRATALQSTSDLVDQLQGQIEQLQARLKQPEFNFRASQEENAQIRQKMAERTVVGAAAAAARASL